MATGWLRKRSSTGEDTDCCPACEAEVDSTLTYCTVCGYDIVKQAKIDLGRAPGPTG